MDETVIGYARCSTDEQHLTAQRQALHALGVPPDRVYVDHILATFAEFEVDLIRIRTREGMAVARAQGRLKGRQPKLSPMQRELKRMHETGEYTVSDLGELFSVSWPTV